VKRYVSFGISKARYDESRTRLVKAEIYKIRNGNLGIRKVMQRGQLMDVARLGLTVATIRVRDICSFDLIEAVELVKTTEGTFLSVAGNLKSRDDLGELPLL
jgi:hypothetical protein